MCLGKRFFYTPASVIKESVQWAQLFVANDPQRALFNSGNCVNSQHDIERRKFIGRLSQPIPAPRSTPRFYKSCPTIELIQHLQKVLVGNKSCVGYLGSVDVSIRLAGQIHNCSKSVCGC
jgi:hypothetical protein